MALAACGREIPTPVARFADAPPAAASPALEAGRYVVVDEVSRPVLSAPRVFHVAHACTPAVGLAPGTCSVDVPPEAASAPALLLEITLYAERGEKEGRVERILLPTPPGGVLPLPRGFRPYQIRRVELRGVPPFESADRTVGPFEIPAGAALRFSIALDEAMRGVAPGAVAFEVSALDVEGERRLFERVLDPAAQDAHAWQDVDVSLDALRGRTMSLRFRARPVGGGNAPAAFPLWGDPTVWAPERAAERPTIVLVSLDTLRARSTSTWGNPRETTPYLTRLAGDAVLFEHAYSTFSNTLGSHMSMMTGLYPAEHGVIGLDRTLGAEHRTLAESLRAAGYETAAFTEDALLEGALGFQRGFSRYAANKGVFAAAGDAPGTFSRALGWARTRGTQPFFLFVHTYAVHLPYEPPHAYADLFTKEGPAPPANGPEHHRLRYEQEIRALDDEVEKLVAGLLEIVPRERLVLVITADHGEEFGEHGQMTHLQLYDEVMHVPLLVVAPGIRGGTRVSAPVSLVDFLPTLLALAGADAPPSDGVALDGVLHGGAPPARSTLYGQSLPYDLTGKQWRFVARDGDVKCMLGEQGDGDCFDLASDPGEHAPLPPATNAAMTAVSAAAAAYRERARPAIAAGSAAPFSSGAADGLDEATRKKLRALGYVH